MQFLRKTGGVQSGILLFGEDIRQPAGLEPETLAYMSIPGVSLTGAQLAALDANIKAIKYGSGITLSSLTLNLSLVVGTTFISNPNVDLRPYKGFLATIVEGVGGAAHTLTETLGAVGTGETLDANIFATYDFTAAGWGQSNATRDSATKFTSTADGGLISKTSATTAGALYRGSVTATIPGTSLRWADTGAVTQYAVLTGSGTATGIATAPAGSSGTVILRLFGTLGQATVTALGLQQVLTPSATGIWATVGTEGGSFNRNPASVTMTITKP